jgi:hypothetical protein
MLTTCLLITLESDDHGITIYLMYFLFRFRSRTLEQSTAWKTRKGVGERWANLRGGKQLRTAPRGLLIQAECVCIHNHTIYSLRPILPFINTNVSRYILVLDTSVFVRGNIGLRTSQVADAVGFSPRSNPRPVRRLLPKLKDTFCRSLHKMDLGVCDWTQRCSRTNKCSLFVLKSIKFILASFLLSRNLQQLPPSELFFRNGNFRPLH